MVLTDCSPDALALAARAVALNGLADAVRVRALDWDAPADATDEDVSAPRPPRWPPGRPPAAPRTAASDVVCRRRLAARFPAAVGGWENEAPPPLPFASPHVHRPPTLVSAPVS